MYFKWGFLEKKVRIIRICNLEWNQFIIYKLKLEFALTSILNDDIKPFISKTIKPVHLSMSLLDPKTQGCN